jgi:cytochrome oxidase Cu insertion factor (SCO1/SenC/PrrC family)
MRARAVATALAVLALTGPALAASPDFAALRVQPYEPPKSAPEFALPDLAGKTVRLSELQGKVVWVFFWATW